MSWTDPRTWQVAEVVTASILNQHVRDNLLQLWNPPACRVIRTAGDGSQSIPNNNDTVVAFPSENFDTDGFHTTGGNNGRITIPSGLDGIYIIGGSIQFAANTTGIRRLLIEQNGDASNPIAHAYDPAPNGTNDSRLTTVTTKSLSAGDYLQLGAFQTSGGALNITINAPAAPVLWAVRIC